MATYRTIQIIAVLIADGENLDFFNDARHRTADGEQSDDKKDKAAPRIGISSATAYWGIECCRSRKIATIRDSNLDTIVFFSRPGVIATQTRLTEDYNIPLHMPIGTHVHFAQVASILTTT